MIFLKWFLLFLALFVVLAKIKADITYENHCKVLRAIKGYRAACKITNKQPLVDFDDMIDYEESAKQIFDWSCKNILPKEKFELIKPFMEEQRK